MTITFLATLILLLIALAGVVMFVFWVIDSMGLPAIINRGGKVLVGVLALVALIVFLFPGVLPIR